MGLLMWAFRIFKREIECSDPDEWREKLNSAMTFESEPATDPMGDMVSGAPAIVAAVCVRDYWDKLSDEQKAWCVERVCSAVLANSNSWNRYAGRSTIRDVAGSQLRMDHVRAGDERRAETNEKQSRGGIRRGIDPSGRGG